MKSCSVTMYMLSPPWACWVQKRTYMNSYISEVLPCSFWGHQLSPTHLKHRCRFIRWQKPLLCSKYLLPNLLSPYPVTFRVTSSPATIISPLLKPTPIRKEISVPLMVTLIHLGLLTRLHTYGATKFKASMMTSFQTLLEWISALI